MGMALEGVQDKDGGIMKNVDWKRKLTSRKFWLSVAAFVSLLIIASGKDKAVAEQVSAIIMAGATVIGYVIGEGLTDASNIEGELTEIGEDGE